MDKKDLNYMVDIALLLTFLLSFVTGVLKLPSLVRFFALHKFLSTYYLTLLHDFSGLLMGVFAAMHIVLHWNWWVATTKALLKR